MQALIIIIQRLITNPKIEAFVIIALTSFLKKKYMEEQEKEKDIKNSQPLFLPRGSVRALITLTLALVVGGSFIWHYELPTEFLALSVFAIGYYVGYRTDNTQLPEIR